MANIEGAGNRGRITAPRVTAPDRPSALERKEAPEPATPAFDSSAFEDANIALRARQGPERLPGELIIRP